MVAIVKIRTDEFTFATASLNKEPNSNTHAQVSMLWWLESARNIEMIVFQQQSISITQILTYTSSANFFLWGFGSVRLHSDVKSIKTNCDFTGQKHKFTYFCIL